MTIFFCSFHRRGNFRTDCRFRLSHSATPGGGKGRGCAFCFYLLYCTYRRRQRCGRRGALCSKKASKEKFDKMKMIVTVNGQHFTATLAQNSAADALAQALQQGALSLSLRDYAGFEKVGSLGRRFPAGDSRMTARPGDLMLYQGNQLVLFYGSNTWSYTRLGHIDDLTGWAEALGGDDVTVILSLKN